MCSTRRGQLANARKTKLTQIPVECFSDVQMPDPRENVANLTEMANFIKENGTEDFKVYSDTMCAIYRGVSSLSCWLWAPQLSCLSCSGVCHVYRGSAVTANTLNSPAAWLSASQACCKCNSCSTHLPNVETYFHCPQAILSLNFHCRTDICAKLQRFGDSNSCSYLCCFNCLVSCLFHGRGPDAYHFTFM